MKFLKFNHKFASHDGLVQYRILYDPSPEGVEEILEEITEEFSYSDKYRGAEYDVLDTIPDVELLSMIDQKQKNAINILETVIELFKILNKNKGLS